MLSCCILLGFLGGKGVELTPILNKISDYSAINVMYNYMKQCKVLFLVLHEGQAYIFYFVCIILSNFYSSKNKLNLLKFICKGSKDLLQGIFLGFENRNSNLAFLPKNKKQFQATLLSPMNQDL